MMDALVSAAAVAIALFAALAAVDGLYLHLWKYRLHTRPESRLEHLTHTLHALLLAPIVTLLFSTNVGGAALWLAIALVVLDFGIQSWDVTLEKASRASLGGLSPFEYLVHTTAITVRVIAVTLVFASKPPSAWSLSSPLLLPAPVPDIAVAVAGALIPGALAVAALHLVLMLPRFRDPSRAT